MSYFSKGNILFSRAIESLNKTLPLFLIIKFKGDIISKLYISLILVAAISAGFCTLYSLGFHSFETSVTLPSVLGAALGILLVFRNNTAYDRWWEARKVVGSLVNTCRNLAFQACHLIDDPKMRYEVVTLNAAFAFALKEHLRGGVKMEEITFLTKKTYDKIQNWTHKPNGIVFEILKYLKKVYKSKQITDFQYLKLVEDTDELIDILGKCERIHSTPMPLSHNYLLKSYIFLYTLIMPFGFIRTFEWWTIAAVTTIHFLSMSIVVIAEEIEDPFGLDPNDLPMDTIVGKIYANIREIYNEKSIGKNYIKFVDRNVLESTKLESEKDYGN